MSAISTPSDGTPQGGSGATVKTSSRQLRYMAQSVLLEEMGVSGPARAVVLVISLMVVAFVVWASFLTVQEVAVTYGSVVPKSSLHTVQHLEGGIVREVLVEERQMVDAGQSLVRLDPIQAQSDLEQTQARLADLRLRAERLRAFADRRDADLISVVPPRFRHLVIDHEEILRANRERWDTQRKVLLSEISQKEEEIAAAHDQQTATGKQLALLKEEEALRQRMYESQLSTKVDYFAIRRQVAAMESESHRLEGQENTAREALGELRDRLEDLDSNMRQDALNELGTVTAELAQVEETMARASDRAERLTITAPVRGFVQNLQIHNVGAVVPAGGLLMEIVPVDDELQVESRISTRDVGHLRIGQKVSVKVGTFDFIRYGDVKGTLRSISATTYVDENSGESYYKAKIDLEHPYVKSKENALTPGMTVQADIVTGEKTLMEYILKPIFISLNQSFRER
jgi:HlyD family type I secretion membrane fusion protein